VRAASRPARRALDGGFPVRSGHLVALTILAWVFGICALLSAACTPFVVVRELRLRRHGNTVVGTIAELEPDNENGYTAYVHYVVGVAPHTLGVPCSLDEYQAGDRVRVRYLPQDPREASIDEPGHAWRGTVTCVALALTFGVVSIALCSFA
jgi:hypothetical protein